MWTPVMVRAASERCDVSFMLSETLCSKGWHLPKQCLSPSMKCQSHEAE